MRNRRSQTLARFRHVQVRDLFRSGDQSGLTQANCKEMKTSRTHSIITLRPTYSSSAPNSKHWKARYGG